jgi:hypothetical protein
MSIWERKMATTMKVVCCASMLFVYALETIAEAEISADGEDNEAEMAALKEVCCEMRIGVWCRNRKFPSKN